MTTLTKSLWTTLAVLFLAVSWLWDAMVPVVRVIIDLLPLENLKRWASTLIGRLPPYGVLCIFLIPIFLSEGIKLVAFWLFSQADFLAGVAVYLFAEILRFGLAAFIFETCRVKLLSIGWFATLHGWFVWAKAWSAKQVQPIKDYARASLAAAGLTGTRAGLWLRLKALWRYSRRRTV